jgi:hypothetical protein
MKVQRLSPLDQNYNDKLSKLGLKAEWFIPIAERALLAFNSATPHDPKSAAGINCYNMVVRTLRDILCPKGWKSKTEHNLEITLNESTGISIIVSSGDNATGTTTTPKTKNSKGEQTKKVVLMNRMEPGLFDEYDLKRIKKKKTVSSTWVLLYCIDKNAKQVRMELSLPTEIDYFDTRISSWEVRIPLPTLDFNVAPEIKPEEFVENIEPEIKRKSNDR